MIGSLGSLGSVGTFFSHYVLEFFYAPSSFLTPILGQVLGTAFGGASQTLLQSGSASILGSLQTVSSSLSSF